MIFRNNSKGRKGRSIFRTVLYPLLFVVLLEALLLQGSLSESGVLGKLNQNEQDILKKQIQTRGTFLQNTIANSWSDFSFLSNKMNETTQHLLDNGEISLEKLDQGSQECEALLEGISKDLISCLYAKRVSGIFIILNTHDLDGEEYTKKPGLYIRDFDPLSPLSKDYSDLIFGRAPISLVESLNISTDRQWTPLFEFNSELSDYDFFYEPFQAAYKNKANSLKSLDYGYWTTSPSLLAEGGNNSIAYSIPLILEDGSVYGVLGIELLPDYLKAILPSEELHIKGNSGYVVGVQNPEDLSWSPVLVSGALQINQGEAMNLQPLDGGGYTVQINDEPFISHFMELPLYRSNTPFSRQRWALIGMVEENQLYAFSNQVAEGLKLSFIMTILVGVIGSVVVSRRLSKPIFILSKEVSEAQKNKEGIPELSVTKIHEIDRFAEAFTSLSKDIVNSSSRFLSMLDMASVSIGGFEIQKKEGTVFATKPFFELLGWENVDTAELTLTKFLDMIEDMKDCILRSDEGDGSCLYHLERLDGSVRYIRIKVTENQERVVGIAEDVTQSTVERLRIEHERDYDLLTGLYNRRAFYRQVSELFKQPHRLKNAAILMIDLDNLKIINDRYGHDCGDKYIRRAGQSFVDNLPKSTICSRVSGDEFFFFLYGYEDKESMRQILTQLDLKVNNTWVRFPNGEPQKIGASGGIAWYPDDSKDFQELMKLADTAMYRIKHGKKGEFCEFEQDTP
ncbi:GGDEF domain-containing protein [Anaerotignum sp. MB30-C6]|uniref:GGDEF domain-containing protein n=1 Tax=Anaerotignum sp. MB30-C6 TaxID=3070814 RepID=UPI0027DB99CE|nr:GGDEF domain-containing protein [Anaerotignum sp. MB30-C6]WMI81095.1 GGDEF domain-containing protein [Anaerotignum sp. MB30-C6]